VQGDDDEGFRNLGIRFLESVVAVEIGSRSHTAKTKNRYCCSSDDASGALKIAPHKFPMQYVCVKVHPIALLPDSNWHFSSIRDNPKY